MNTSFNLFIIAVIELSRGEEVNKPKNSFRDIKTINHTRILLNMFQLERRFSSSSHFSLWHKRRKRIVSIIYLSSWSPFTLSVQPAYPFNYNSQIIDKHLV